MKTRTAIAALIAAGRSNPAIAAELGVDRGTVNRARHRIRSGRDLLGRLAVEEAPAGVALRRREWTPAEQQCHREELLAALRGAA